jgi:cytochrome c-type biogenesis protein CcmH/NrfG
MLEKMLEKSPGNVRALVQLGNVYLNAGNHDKAAEAYRKALKVNPQDADIMTQLGVAYRRMGKSSDAAASFRNALKLQPDHPFALVNLGIVLRKDIGDKKGALKTFEALLSSSEGHRFSKMVTPWIEQLRKEIAPKESSPDAK